MIYSLDDEPGTYDPFDGVHVHVLCCMVGSTCTIFSLSDVLGQFHFGILLLHKEWRGKLGRSNLSVSMSHSCIRYAILPSDLIALHLVALSDRDLDILLPVQVMLPLQICSPIVYYSNRNYIIYKYMMHKNNFWDNSSNTCKIVLFMYYLV